MCFERKTMWFWQQGQTWQNPPHGAKKHLKPCFSSSKEGQKLRTLETPKRQSIRGKQALKDISYTVESSRSWSAEIFITKTARYHTVCVPVMDFFSFQILAWLFLYSSFLTWGYDPILGISLRYQYVFTCNWIFYNIAKRIFSIIKFKSMMLKHVKYIHLVID
jgi:hypothetical protein